MQNLTILALMSNLSGWMVLIASAAFPFELRLLNGMIRPVRGHGPYPQDHQG